MLHTPRQPGQAIVELAIALPVLLFFTLGTLDVGRVFYTYLGLTNAAHEGARRATLLGPACDAATLASVRSTVRAAQPGLFPASVPDSVITLDCSAADRRRVTITAYPFTTVAPWNWFARTSNPGLAANTTIELTTWATMPLVN